MSNWNIVKRLSLAVAVAAGAGPVVAQEMPCATARIIVPFGPGGHSDITARIFERAMNGQGISPQVQVVNIAGQSGNTGAKEVLDAAPDGCTMLFTHQSLVSAYLTGRVDFTWSDFSSVARLTTTPVVVSASPNAPFSDLPSLRAYAQENPNSVLTAVSLGSTSHFAMGTLAAALDARLRYVSYDGAAERIQALLGDVIHLTEMTESTAQQYIGTGDMQIVAVLSAERQPGMPDVPTAVEQGIDAISGNVLGLVLPGNTPDAIVAHYEEALRTAIADPEVIAQVEARGSTIEFLDAADYSAWWAETAEEWTGLASDMEILAAR